MIVFLLLLIVGGVAIYRRSDPFLVVSGSLLLTPLVAMPLLYVGIASSPLTYTILLLGLAIGLSSGKIGSERSRLCPEFLALGVSFAFFYGLSCLWPDFISIGERLRDYAILSSVIDSPAIAREPWLHGSVLNYYLYWYRFGAMLASLGGVDAAHAYHLLVAFTFSLFFAALLGCARFLLGLSTWPATIVATLIAIGSNYEGIRTYLDRDSNWWRPSRIIDGGHAISEFPAWSFLLGDAHPHYLNLALVPIFVLCAGKVMSRYRLSKLATIAVVLPWWLLTSVWVFGANAWELPAWLAVSGLLVFGWVVRSSGDRAPTLAAFTPLQCIALGVSALMLSVLLWPAVMNITPADAPLTLVSDPVRPSLTFEFLRHWGLPFVVLAIILPLHLKRMLSRIAAYVGLVLFLLLPMPGYLIGLLLLCAIAAFLYEVSKPGKESTWVAHALGVAGLVLVLFPELFFFNDPYGGDTERMNTIFKFYTTAWFMVHLYACGLLLPYCTQAWRKSVMATCAVGMVVVALMTGFFFRTVQIRKISGESVNEVLRGLRSVDREFPGSASAILFLDQYPRAVVLEAQGNPYSYTSFVGTLSNHDSYLGWANHVNLLTKEYENIRHREEATRAFYELTDCEEGRRLLKKEGISFVVVGELERRAFPNLNAGQFQCLPKVFEREKYAIYTP